MESMYSALFKYAKADQHFARENFTTEALAGAIRLDREPFRLWLVERELADAGSTLERAQTQVREAEGIPDLIVDLGPGERGAQVILEVKVDAPESGHQLARYDELADRLGPRGIQCRDPVVLGRRPVDAKHRLIKWHDLRRFLLGLPQLGGVWREFAQYLVEISMADEWDMPITSDEARALGPAFRLARKMTRAVHDAIEDLRGAGGDCADFANKLPRTEGPGRSSLLDQVQDRLIRYGQLSVYPTIAGQFLWPTVILGAWAEDAAGKSPSDSDTRVGVWISTKPQQRELRRELLSHPAVKALEKDGWQREPADSNKTRILSSTEPLAALCSPSASDNDAIKQYLVTRVEALSEFGLLRFIMDQWTEFATDAVVVTAETAV